MQVDDWAKRFNEVIGEVESVLFAVMKETNGRVQAMRDQSARDGTTQHGVTIIECGIAPAFFGAIKARAEKLSEVEFFI